MDYQIWSNMIFLKMYQWKFKYNTYYIYFKLFLHLLYKNKKDTCTQTPGKMY